MYFSYAGYQILHNTSNTGKYMTDKCMKIYPPPINLPLINLHAPKGETMTFKCMKKISKIQTNILKH